MYEDSVREEYSRATPLPLPRPNDVRFNDVLLIVEIDCKITKKIRIMQVFIYKFLIFANKFA